MKVSALYRYPVKSLGGQSVQQLTPTGRGFADDRRWMFTAPDGMFITRRSTPKLAEFAAEVHDDELRFVRVANGEMVGAIAGARVGTKGKVVTVWDDTFTATHIDRPEVDPLTEILGIPGAHLVYMDTDDVRPVDPRYARPQETVSFADGYPYLVTNTASLADLASRVGDPQLDIRRFRPNIVVEHDVPFAEDGWAALKVGNHRFRLPKPCARCVMVTQDPDTGVRNPRIMGELVRYRKKGTKILFGMNACWEGGPGTLRTGDPVSVA